MIINRTGILDRNPYRGETKGSPVFLRQPARADRGTDQVEISDEARSRLDLERLPRWMRTPGVFTDAQVREFGAIVREKDEAFAAERRERLDALARAVRDGRYDFGNMTVMKETADRIAGEMMMS
ncbi:MAG: hypothetical protein EPN93_21040 [Spirochaetes bacterium]|nr:MAG: hypothetical protein EPN93_21040 [Spirochaetota bacterium]